MSLMGESHRIVHVDRIHNIEIVQRTQGRQGVGALPVNRADNDCGSRKQLTDDASKLLRLLLPSIGIKVRLIEQLRENSVRWMTTHYLGKAGPGILHLLQRRFRILLMQSIELISGVQVERHTITQG